MKVKTERNLESNISCKSLNFHWPQVLHLKSKFWVLPLVSKVMKFSMTSIQGSSSFPLDVGLNSKIVQVSWFCPELNFSSANYRDHNSWTVGRMRVRLYFLERYQNYLPLLYCSFLLILYQIQSAWFCEIVVSPNQNLSSFEKLS
jgi:hypothetical protein